MNESFIIRQFNSDDAKILSEIIIRCLLEINSKDYNKNIIEGMCKHFDEETIIAQANKKEMWVAENNGIVIGTVTRERNLVFTMFINPDNIGQGIGRKLMSHIEDLAFKDGYTFMETGASITARDFYRSLGYIDVRESHTELAGLNYILRKAFIPMSKEELLSAPLSK